MSKKNECKLCKEEFGFFRWEYQCKKCKRAVMIVPEIIIGLAIGHVLIVLQKYKRELEN